MSNIKLYSQAETVSQTDKQRDRQTGRQTDRQTDRGVSSSMNLLESWHSLFIADIETQSDSSSRFLVRVSFLQIYNEKIMDLLVSN